jgi:hypothetical protein
MAKKRRLKYACEFCRKPFDTPEEKWGHYPHCAARKLSLQAGTLAGPEAPPSALADREPRRPGPDSQENRLCLLETHELIQQLRQDARTIASMAAGFAQMNVPGEYDKAKEWIAVFQGLEDVERESDQMVGRLQLDQTQLFWIYHQMGPLRGAWMHYRTCDVKPAVEGEKEQEIWGDIREEAAMWATVMTNIKKMLVASR